MSTMTACAMPPRGYFLSAASSAENGIVEGPLHEDLAQRLRDEDLAPARVLEQPRPLPRRVLGEVERPQTRGSCR
jgi:hypothetical protein